MLSKILLSSITIAVSITSAFGATCTAAQLKGTYGTFNLPGGGGAYQQGTQQVVSWNWPTGSTVTQIKSLVIRGSSNIAPSAISGIPVNFVSTQPDQGGAIFVTLPNPLASGQYVFRVTLRSAGVDCTINSAVFTVVPGNNINECNIGDARCVNNNGGLQNCINTANGRRFGSTVTCQAGTSCKQTGNTAQCTSGGINQCTLGTKECTGEASFRECVRDPATGFTIWSGSQPCSRGNLCSGNGVCAPPVVSCTTGHQRCISSTVFQTCVDNKFAYDQNCGTGTVCQPYLGNYIVCGLAPTF